MKFIVICALLACSACESASYSKAKKVTIDGDEFHVSYANNRENVWIAIPKPGSPLALRTGDNTIYGRNVRAIEAVSKCRVDPMTIDNDNNYTTAAVACD